ncbi:unnamed protein product [Spirodela intermedia]|uniref:Protein kinase domain-containing protein n=1 Tax=Spirodela intermedia TaxID=51605 RepID=A0A7I8K2M1_SPIIN|nr:unnamed protein product [Spirodela intermedia]
MKCFAFLNHWQRRGAPRGPVTVEAPPVAPPQPEPSPAEELSLAGTSSPARSGSSGRRRAEKFSFRELAVITKNFKDSNCLGEGGFGKVYKGRLQTGELVAIKLLNLLGEQGRREFLLETLMLVVLEHPNLVKLVGYCAEGDQRLLVYEFMPQGSLESHIHDLPTGREALRWDARVKIALGAARGVSYLHHAMNPSVIHRDIKSANILLDDEFNPKVSDFGIAKFGPVGDETHVSTRVMGTYGYCAPEYAMTGKLTAKSDVYSFGVVLLELITGRKAFNTSARRNNSLVIWVRPYLRNGLYSAMADPALRGQYPERAFRQMAMAAMTMVREDPRSRPTMLEVVAALEFISSGSDASPSTSDSAARSGPATQ